MSQSVNNPLGKGVKELKGSASSEIGGANREWEVGTKKGLDEETGKHMSY